MLGRRATVSDACSPPSARVFVAVPLVFALAYAGRLGALYDDAIGFHASARDGGLKTSSAGSAALLRGPADGLDLARRGRGAGVASALRRDRGRGSALALGSGRVGVLLVWHRPLLDHHFVLFAAAFSGRRRSGARGRGAAHVPSRSRLHSLWRPAYSTAVAPERSARPRPRLTSKRQRLLCVDATAPGESIVTDLPIVAYLADRPLPGELVDTSAVRFDAGSLDNACVLTTADASGARVVVVGRLFRIRPELLAAIRERFPSRRAIGEITLYERPRAAARAAQAAAPESCSDRTAARARSSSAAAPSG